MIEKPAFIPAESFEWLQKFEAWAVKCGHYPIAVYLQNWLACEISEREKKTEVMLEKVK